MHIRNSKPERKDELECSTIQKIQSCSIAQWILAYRVYIIMHFGQGSHRLLETVRSASPNISQYKVRAFEIRHAITTSVLLTKGWKKPTIGALESSGVTNFGFQLHGESDVSFPRRHCLTCALPSCLLASQPSQDRLLVLRRAPTMVQPENV
eukprot:COSAG02_NODE_713_length_18120_cov_27.173409_5_plen_152_part_00